MPIPAFLASLESLFRFMMVIVTKLLQTAEVLPTRVISEWIGDTRSAMSVSCLPGLPAGAVIPAEHPLREFVESQNAER